MGQTRHGSNLNDFAMLTGWVTPSSRDWKDSPGMALARRDGRARLDQLPRQAQLAGWPTPCGQDGPHGGPAQGADRLPGAAALAAWNTPAASDGTGGKRPHPDTTLSGRHPSGRKVNMGLASQAHIGFIATIPARWTASGTLRTGCSARMGNGGRLNPAHSRWLMGFPPEWDACAPMETPSSRKSRRRSSANSFGSSIAE
jgi:hypothetical protein